MFKIQLLKPNFWDKSKLNFYSILLIPLTFITIVINFFKKFSKKKVFRVKTICIGNIYLGGTGKTQLVLKLNEILKSKYKLFVIKKNYLDQIDEQDLLRDRTRLILSKNRAHGIQKVNKIKKGIAILDDGLQDKSIKYHLSIVCFNSLVGVGNGRLLPAGPLRESLSEIKNYDIAFLNGEKNLKLANLIKSYNKDIKIIYGKYILKNKKNFNLDAKYFAFCGIGNPSSFFKLLEQNKINVKKSMIFPDHYKYEISDINKIKKYAYKNNLKIVTTEKDFMKIKKFKNLEVKKTIVDLKIDNLTNLKKFLINNL